VSTVTDAVDEGTAGRSTGRVVAAAILGVVGILLIIAAILYFTQPAHSLPSFLGTIKYNGHNHARAYSHRNLRGIVSIIVGVICLIAAWFAYFWKSNKASD
jgi:uncharacterized membrane protein HdeD (DUF308 family)